MIAARSPRRRWAAAASLALMATFSLSACAESNDGGNSASGDGLAPGATKEEYQKAFADVSPIKLNTQSPGPKGGPTGAPVERWVEAVEEWSDGKITFEVGYSNAIAAPTEIDDALRDGRLDVASALPIYEPSEYPVNAAIIETGFISDQSPVAGVLQSNAWPNALAFKDDAFMAEYEDNGMVPLVPFFNSGAQIMLCSNPHTSPADFKGSAVSASGTAQSSQIEALGASPVSIAYTELYESMQRKVVECASTTFTVANLGGFMSAAPHVTVSNSVGFSMAPGAWAFSKDAWDDLPLVAQQLIWDLSTVFVESNITDKIWPDTVAGAKVITEVKGSVNEFDEASLAALTKQNDSLLAAVRKSKGHPDGSAMVDMAESLSAEWLEKVTALKLPAEVSYAGFDKVDTKSFDMNSYTDLLAEEIWSERRPS